MSAVGFRMAVERPNSEARQVNIHIYDMENGLTGIVDDTIEYKIVRKNIASAEEKVVAVISKKDDNMKIANNLVSITYIDTPELYATEYLYRCDKIKEDYTLVDFTDTYSVSTLPQRIEKFKINYNNSDYNELGVPIRLSFDWQTIDTAVNNFAVIGYNIYYSMSPRGLGEWGEWNRLHGTSTDQSKDSVIKLIRPKESDIKIDTPQIADTTNPMDIMFAIVAVTLDGRKSQFSDVATCSLYNTITQIIKGGTGGTVNLRALDDKTRPVKLEFEAGAFTRNTTVLLNRSQYNPSLGKVGSKDFQMFTYNIKASQPLAKWFTVKVDLNLYLGQVYEVRIFNQTTKAWEPIPSTYNDDTNQVEIIMTTVTSFVVIVRGTDPQSKILIKPNEVFAKYTNKIIQKLPSWFKMRRDPINSVGAQFLEVTGLEYDNMEFILNYAYEQSRIDKADLSQTDVVYKAQLPGTVSAGDTVKVTAESFLLQYTSILSEFFNLGSGLEPIINYDNPYIVDYEERYAYVRKPYNPDSDNKYGKVRVTVYRKGELTPTSEPYFDEIVSLKLHHVWNFFDEFGMLLNTQRLLGESNAEYKERILDVFKNVSNASRDGLFNGIAREVGIRINRKWEDTTQDFLITEPMVTVNLIKINGSYVDTKNIYYTTDGNILIKNKGLQFTNGSEVSYVSGIEMHTFHNRKDIRLYNQLYTIEETATELFKYYADLIKQKVPTDWGKFRWNEGYWDITDEKMSGVGFLPVIYDGKYKGFEVIDEAGNRSGHLTKKSRAIAVKPMVIFPPTKYVPTGKQLPGGISIIPNDCEVIGSYWTLTPTNPVYEPGTGPIDGTPQTMGDVKDYIESTIGSYIPSNSTTAEELAAAFDYGITDPGVTFELGSLTIVPSTLTADGSLHGSVLVHKAGEADIVIPINIPISKATTDGANINTASPDQVFSGTPGTYKYTQYVVYNNPDGTSGVVSQSYTYTVADDTIEAPTYVPVSTTPAKQAIVKANFPSNAVHKQYRIGTTGNWIDYPEGGILMIDNGDIYTRADNVFGTWSEYGVIHIGHIDNIPPTATVSYSSTTPTYGTVRVYCYPEDGSTIINNGGVPYYDFTANGEFTFDVQDIAGNITHKKVGVSNIVVPPNVVIDYSTLAIIDGDVTATVVSDKPITITNNGGSFEYVFHVNGEFTFHYKDAYGIAGSIKAVVNNIYHVPPNVHIDYSETAITDQDVIATVISDKPITITNNGGSPIKVFHTNGTFRFYYTDDYGTTYSIDAIVNNISRELHIVPKVDGAEVYTYTDFVVFRFKGSSTYHVVTADVDGVATNTWFGASTSLSSYITVPIDPTKPDVYITVHAADNGPSAGSNYGFSWDIIDARKSQGHYASGTGNPGTYIIHVHNRNIIHAGPYVTTVYDNVYGFYDPFEVCGGTVHADMVYDRPCAVINDSGVPLEFTRKFLTPTNTEHEFNFIDNNGLAKLTPYKGHAKAKIHNFTANTVKVTKATVGTHVTDIYTYGSAPFIKITIPYNFANTGKILSLYQDGILLGSTTSSSSSWSKALRTDNANSILEFKVNNPAGTDSTEYVFDIEITDNVIGLSSATQNKASGFIRTTMAVSGKVDFHNGYASMDKGESIFGQKVDAIMHVNTETSYFTANFANFLYEHSSYGPMTHTWSYWYEISSKNVEVYVDGVKYKDITSCYIGSGNANIDVPIDKSKPLTIIKLKIVDYPGGVGVVSDTSFPWELKDGGFGTYSRTADFKNKLVNNEITIGIINDFEYQTPSGITLPDILTIGESGSYTTSYDASDIASLKLFIGHDVNKAHAPYLVLPMVTFNTADWNKIDIYNKDGAIIYREVTPDKVGHGITFNIDIWHPDVYYISPSNDNPPAAIFSTAFDAEHLSSGPYYSRDPGTAQVTYGQKYTLKWNLI